VPGDLRPPCIDRWQDACKPDDMRLAVVLAAALVARVASAQPAEPSPEGAPLPTPATDPAAQPPAAPPAEASAPPADPAYGDRPDHTVQGAVTDQPGIRRGRDIVVRYTPSRTKQNLMLLAALGSAGLVAGAVGLYFHFDSRTASDEVSALNYTGRAWTSDRQATFDQAHASARAAGIAYGIGGALLLTTAIVWMVTEPGQKEMVITPHLNPKPTATLIAPTRGGAILGGEWTF
jgi:hypothetical protein